MQGAFAFVALPPALASQLLPSRSSFAVLLRGPPSRSSFVVLLRRYDHAQGGQAQPLLALLLYLHLRSRTFALTTSLAHMLVAWTRGGRDAGNLQLRAALMLPVRSLTFALCFSPRLTFGQYEISLTGIHVAYPCFVIRPSYSRCHVRSSSQCRVA